MCLLLYSCQQQSSEAEEDRMEVTINNHLPQPSSTLIPQSSSQTYIQFNSLFTKFHQNDLHLPSRMIHRPLSRLNIRPQRTILLYDLWSNDLHYLWLSSSLAAWCKNSSSNQAHLNHHQAHHPRFYFWTNTDLKRSLTAWHVLSSNLKFLNVLVCLKRPETLTWQDKDFSVTTLTLTNSKVVNCNPLSQLQTN